jgi:hypothetical protein
VIDVQPALEHHFFQITIAERIAHVPAHAQKNDVWLEMTPFERGLLGQDEELLGSASNKEEFIITSSFLQHNPFPLQCTFHLIFITPTKEYFVHFSVVL